MMNEQKMLEKLVRKPVTSHNDSRRCVTRFVTKLIRGSNPTGLLTQMVVELRESESSGESLAERIAQENDD